MGISASTRRTPYRRSPRVAAVRTDLAHALALHPQFAAEAPEAQQADAELAVHTGPLCRVKMTFQRIAQMGRDALKIGFAVFGWGDPSTVIKHLEKEFALLATAKNLDLLRSRVDRVLRQLADRLERMGLGMSDDVDRIPLIANLELATGGSFSGCGRHGIQYRQEFDAVEEGADGGGRNPPLHSEERG